MMFDCPRSECLGILVVELEQPMKDGDQDVIGRKVTPSWQRDEYPGAKVIDYFCDSCGTRYRWEQ